MLDALHAGLTFEQTIARLESRAELPGDWRADTQRPLPLLGCAEERRHYTRFEYRVRGFLEVAPSLPAVRRVAGKQLVFTKDVSREGIAFYFAEQLFPQERLTLFLPGDTRRALRIMRCRKVNSNCYDIGARFE